MLLLHLHELLKLCSSKLWLFLQFFFSCVGIKTRPAANSLTASCITMVMERLGKYFMRKVQIPLMLTVYNQGKELD